MSGLEVGTGSFGLAFGEANGPAEAAGEASGISGAVSFVGEGLVSVWADGAQAAINMSAKEMAKSAILFTAVFFFHKTISITIYLLFL